VASKLTKWHFAPTAFSRQNLLDERVPDAAISVTGNTVIDALFWMLGRIDADAQRLCDNNCSISAGVSVFAYAMVCVSLNHVFALTALCFHIFIRTTRYRMSPARLSGYLWLAMAKRTACG